MIDPPSSVLVTGAGSGIGRAIALRLAGRGAQLALLDIDASAVDLVAKEATAAGSPTALALHADVSDAAQVAHCFDRAADTFDRLDGLATAAGCQLVASCDLAVAAESAAFALPGGKGGWFCHTPAVPVARAIGRKRLMEMALTGDPVDARTAEHWGLVNRVVPDDQLDTAVTELLHRATRGSRQSKALGKQVLYAQLDRPESDAYTIAAEAMAAASQTPQAREGMAAFLEKRPPVWPE